MSDFLIEGTFILAGIGFWLFLGFVVSSITSKYRAGARHFLKRASYGGAFTATAMAVFFMFEPDISMPGPGNYAVIAAIFFAGFAAVVLVTSVLRWIRQKA